MVALNQVASSDTAASVRPSLPTCRSDQPPNSGALAENTTPPRHRRRPTRRSSGRARLNGISAVPTWSGVSCAKAWRVSRANAEMAQTQSREKSRATLMRGHFDGLRSKCLAHLENDAPLAVAAVVAIGDVEVAADIGHREVELMDP